MCIVCGGSVCAGSGACTQASRSLIHYVYMACVGGGGYLLFRIRNSLSILGSKIKKGLVASTKDHPYIKMYKWLFRK